MYNSEHIDPRQVQVFRQFILVGVDERWRPTTLLAYAQALEETAVELRQKAADIECNEAAKNQIL